MAGDVIKVFHNLDAALADARARGVGKPFTPFVYPGYPRCRECGTFHPPGTLCPDKCGRCGQKHYSGELCEPPKCGECNEKHYLDEPCQRHEIACKTCGFTHWDNAPCPRSVSRNMDVIEYTCDVCERNGDDSRKTVLSFEADCGGDSAFICMEHLRQVMEKGAQGVVGEFFPCGDDNG